MSAFWALANNVTYYATGRAALVLYGTNECVKAYPNLAVLGYAVTYNQYSAEETSNLT